MSSTVVAAESPPTKIFFVLVTILGVALLGKATFGSMFFPSSSWCVTAETLSTARGSLNEKITDLIDVIREFTTIQPYYNM